MIYTFVPNKHIYPYYEKLEINCVDFYSLEGNKHEKENKGRVIRNESLLNYNTLDDTFDYAIIFMFD